MKAQVAFVQRSHTVRTSEEIQQMVMRKGVESAAYRASATRTCLHSRYSHQREELRAMRR